MGDSLSLEPHVDHLTALRSLTRRFKPFPGRSVSVLQAIEIDGDDWDRGMPAAGRDLGRQETAFTELAFRIRGLVEGQAIRTA